MKIFKRKHFQALIYSIFLALPLLSVLGRCVYTIVNKNAKDSYYGETINEKTYNNVILDDLNANTLYEFQNTLIPQDTWQQQTIIFNITYFNPIAMPTIQVDEVVRIQLYGSGSNYRPILKLIGNENTEQNIDLSNNIVTFEFQFDYLTHSVAYDLFDDFYYKITYNEYSYLDNAFEYSIDRFVSENDYGNFDFFQWFSTFFLSNTSINNLYIHFVNWYLNYVLYVSLGYLIFSVLFWFVNFFRRLVEDTQNINVGGM